VVVAGRQAAMTGRRRTKEEKREDADADADRHTERGADRVEAGQGWWWRASVVSFCRCDAT
jgi:hypothetical protein